MGKAEQGVNGDRYMVIPRTLIFLTRGEKVLLQKASASKRLWPGRYNGIGGHVEAGEDVWSAARRETLEETGLIPEDLWLCGTIFVDTGTSPGVGVFVFRGESQAGEAVESAEGKLEWVDPADLHRLITVEDLPILLPMVLQLERGAPPFSAIYRYDDDDHLIRSFADQVRS
jgi:8-oxo-dGTP diphosphatase